MANPWFESVAEAQRRAKKRLPKGVYGALVAGSERGLTTEDNLAAFAELGFAPHAAGLANEKNMATHRHGPGALAAGADQPDRRPGRHPDGEVDVARAAASRGTAMGLSSMASKPMEEVIAANPKTFFQLYWVGDRDVMAAKVERARRAGAAGLIATLDWSFAYGRDWGSPFIPERINFEAARRYAPQVITKPRWLWTSRRPGRSPTSPCRTWSPPPATRPPPSSRPTASGCSPPCPPGRTSPGCASCGAPTSRSCSRASCGSTTPSAPSTPASPRSRCPTTAATTSTARRPSIRALPVGRRGRR